MRSLRNLRLSCPLGKSSLLLLNEASPDKFSKATKLVFVWLVCVGNFNFTNVGFLAKGKEELLPVKSKVMRART